MAAREFFLTREGQQSLEDELEHLTTVRRQEVAGRIRTASQSGGTVDNAQYDEAKKEQAFVEGRIRDLEGILSEAVIAPNGDQVPGTVRIGSSVTVIDAYGAKQRYRVVGSAEAAPLERRISNESPVGQALMGRKVGDEVSVDTPAGRVTLTITKVI